ncbi:MAG: hypothetical protein O2890_01025 [Cyanobacteria bacterium]|nr:hypothetical protein [Cyanobacteriota bacterium]MDA0865006.1 hypothetical protein [Cyanobacteriota bacterium]
MASFYPYLAGITGTLGGLSLMAYPLSPILPTAVATDLSPQQLSLADLQQTEYTLDVPGRGQIVASPIGWAEFIAAANTSNLETVYGQVVLIDGSEAELDLPIIYRDLDGDQFEEALVTLWVMPQNADDTNGYTALATLLNQGGHPVHVSTEWPGFLYEVTERDDQIIAYVEGRPEDGYQEQVLTYDWTVNGLEKVSQEPISLDGPFPEGRDRYWVSARDRWESVRATADPLGTLQALFAGWAETQIPQQDWVVLTETEDRIVVGLTHRGLQDDSVSAIRYRFEFVAEGPQWRLDWVGQQFSCGWGRGRQSWHHQLCS